MGKGRYDLNSLLGELQKKESKATENHSSDFWKPTLEKGEERAEYMIRFLDNPDSITKFPWVERPAHMFNFPSGKFIYEPCAKKVNNDKCYICEEVNELYNCGDPEKEKIGQKRFAKQRFFHNILVVQDPRDDGKNEGKVMIFECGQKIHGKCIQILKCQELEPEERIYFHPTMGTNFKLIITWQQSFQNYDESYFLRKTSPIEINGEKLDMDEGEKFIEENCHKLNERLLTEKVFKSYEDLKELYLNQGVVSESSGSSKKTKSVGKKEEEEVETDIDETIKKDKVETRNPDKKEKVGVEKEVEKRKPPKDEDEDEDISDITDDDDDDIDEEADLEALLAD